MSDILKTYGFTPANTPPDPLPQAACWLLFRGEDLVLAESATSFPLPLIGSPADLGIETVRTQFLGLLDQGADAIRPSPASPARWTPTPPCPTA